MKSRTHKGPRTGKWIAKAVPRSHKGRLHRALGVPLDKTIPRSKLRRAASKPGVTGRRARLALTLSQLHHKRKRS